MDLNWTCPVCGPIEDALPGAPGEFHCSGLECDEKVEMIPLVERPKSMKKSSPEAKRGRPPKSKMENERRATEEGRKILDRMNNRVRGKPKPKKESDVAKSRHGECSTCHEEKWLLRSDPPTCAGCYRAVNPSKRKTPKSDPVKPQVKIESVTVKPAKRREKTEPVKKKRKQRRPNKKKEVLVDDLRQECDAIENVSRSLEGLSQQAVERVLTYALTRMSQRNELDGSLKIGLLPAPR